MRAVVGLTSGLYLRNFKGPLLLCSASRFAENPSGLAGK